MGKSNNKISDTQVKDKLFLPFDMDKKVEVGFSSVEVSPLGGLAPLMSQKQNVKFLYEFCNSNSRLEKSKTHRAYALGNGNPTYPSDIIGL